VAAAGLSGGRTGEIVVEIERAPQQSLRLEGPSRRGAPPQEAILGFRVRDNGCGFDDPNLQSFETLDSDFKASEGLSRCRPPAVAQGLRLRGGQQ
jgi:hypothetical protein